MTIGADVGGSRIKLVRLQLDEVEERRELEINPDWPQQLTGALLEMAASEERIGVGVAGLLDHGRGVLSWAPHLSGTDVPLGDLLSHALGRPVAVDNDANCATRAEAAGLQRDPVLVVMLGTGIGAGLWTRGDVYRGRAFAGEVGHMVMKHEGELCRCGRRGCWETLVSGWQLAEQGSSSRVLDTAGIWLGRGLFNLSTILDPAVIVVGGGLLIDHGDKLFAPARNELVRLSTDDRFGQRLPPEILAGLHGIWAGAIGAAMLADHEFGE